MLFWHFPAFAFGDGLTAGPSCRRGHGGSAAAVLHPEKGLSTETELTHLGYSWHVLAAPAPAQSRGEFGPCLWDGWDWEELGSTGV